MPVLYELIDRINTVLYSSHFAIHPETGQLALLSAMYFTDDKINKAEFHMILKQLLGDSCKFVPLIGKQVESDREPADMFSEFLEQNEHLISVTIM